MKMDFETQDGFLVMNDLPHDCIFNKVKTGCGATTIAIKNAENYVIAVPTTEIIENKCYPIEQSDKWSAQSKKAGLKPCQEFIRFIWIFYESTQRQTERISQRRRNKEDHLYL